HRMADQQDRDSRNPADMGNEPDEEIELGRAQAGAGLVEQQQPRPCGERARDLEQALMPEGEALGPGLRVAGETDEIEDLDRALPRARLFGAPARRLSGG